MSRIVTLPPAGGLNADGTRPGGWWHQSEKDPRRLVCDVCPRHCSLKPGARGFCFVRENRGGQIVSTTYGRSMGFCIDPIEKKPLGHFYPGTAVLSFGTAGCNLGCKFCQNWSMSRSINVDAACEVADPETIAAAAAELKCRSVAFTYNDPIIWAEYAIDTARACHDAGVKTVAVTSGYIAPGCRETFYRDMDAANVDLKGFTDEFYREYCGGRLEPVLDTLRWLVHESDTWVEITNLIVPQANDSRVELEQMCRWIVKELGPEVPLHFSAFHPDFEVTDRGNTPIATLLMAHDIALQAGLMYVYTGNVSDREHQSTYCPRCKQRVIDRDGYVLGAVHLQHGRCEFCDFPVAGRYDPKPGDWGGRRMPVRIASYARAKKPAVAQGGNPAVTTPAVNTDEESKVENPDAKQPEAPASSAVRPQLSEEQERRIFRAVSRRVAAAVTSQRPDSMQELLEDTAAAPVYGTFVSLKRAGQLRSCCGFMGQSVPLADALDRSSVRAAKEDPRFPPISPSELGHLDMEVWLLWGLQPVTAKGRQRAKAVTIGTHGLQIARGANRGLLLPGVAVDLKLDAEGFLRQVCLKAGLPNNAWLDDDTDLMIFEGYAIRGQLEAEEAADDIVPGAPTSGELAALADFCRVNITALHQGATPSYYLPGAFDGSVCGAALTVTGQESDQELACGQISVRPDMPLQSTLFNLTKAAVRALTIQRVTIDKLHTATIGLTVLLDPAMHGTADQPKLEGVDPKTRAVLVVDASRSVWIFDPEQDAAGLLKEALEQGGFTDLFRARVYSMATISTQPRMMLAQVPQPQAGPDVRPAGVAGMFYPADAEQINSTLDDLFPEEKPRPEAWPAVMVPHAGWTYSGRLAAETFSRVEIPDRVIIFSPRHHPGGNEWAVAPHQKWSLPVGEVESDPELAQRLAGAITGLEADAVAHYREHAVEVHLPLLARLAPKARVVGVTIGGGELSRLTRFAEQLAGVLRDLPDRPLLVISSDMNHFADDEETRRLDRMALDAMETLDPANLYRTVRDNQISMCGMLPAVVVMSTLKELDQLHRCELVGYATSADSSGDTSRVVGYAGMLLG